MPSERAITSKQGKERIEKTAQTLTASFLDDPVFNWLLHTLSPEHHEPDLLNLLRGFMRSVSLSKASFIEIDNYGAVAVLMPPGSALVSPVTAIRAGIISAVRTLGFSVFKRAIFEYEPGTHALLPKGLTKAEQKSYYYVFIMCTDVGRRRQGLATNLLRYMQDQARSDGRPLWLEATTVMSRDLYSKNGFKTVGEVSLGKGKVGPDGLPKKNGEGITIWGMVWRS